MSARERFLLTLTITGFGLMVLFFGGRSVYRLFSNLENEITNAEDAYLPVSYTHLTLPTNPRV